MSTLEELTVVIDADTKRLAKQFDDAHRDITRGFTKLENAAGKSGFASGSGFGKGFVRSYTSDMNQSMKSVIPRPFRDARKQFEAAGKNSGQSFASGFSTEAEKGLSDASRRLSNQAGDTSSRSMRDSGQRGGKSFLGGMTTGLGGFAAVFAPVIGGAVAAAGMIGGAVITASKDFEHAMNGVRAVTMATGDEFEALRDEAQRLGATTAFSATESAQAMEYLGMAGWDTSQILAGMEDVLNLASAGQLELARSADIASNVIAAFGLTAEDSGRVADALAKGATSANVTVEQLGEAFRRFAGPAASAGYTVEQATAALGIFGNVGLQGEVAATGLTKVIGDLNNESSKASQIFRDYGVELRNADGSLRDLSDIMIDAKEAGFDYNDAIAAFGAEHGPKFITALGQSEEDLRKVTDAMEDTTGAADKMADIRMDGLQGAWDELRSAVEGFFITLGDMGVLDKARELVEFATKAVGKFSSILEEHQDVIKPVVDIFWSIVKVVGVVLGVFLAIKGVIAGVGLVVAGLSNPIGWVVLGLGALIAALVTTWKTSETFRDTVTDVWDRVKSTFSDFWHSTLKPGLQELKAWWDEIWPDIRDTAVEAFDSVKQGALDFWEGTLKPAFQDIWAWAKDKWPEIKQGIIDAFQAVKDWWDENGDELLDKIKGFFDEVGNKLSEMEDWWDEHGSTVLGILDWLWNFIGSRIQSGLLFIQGIFKLFKGILTGDWSSIWEGIKSIANSVWVSINGLTNGKLGELWNSVVKKATGIKTSVVNKFNELKDGVLGKIQDLIDGAKEKIQTLHDNTVGKIEDMYNTIIGNSIIPDMVREMIDEVGKLPGGFDTEMGEMNERSVSQARMMASAMNDQISQMNKSVISVMSTLRTQGTKLVQSMGSSVAAAITLLVATVIKSMSGLVSGMVSLLAGMSSTSVRSTQQMGAQMVRAFDSMVQRMRASSSSLASELVRVFSRMGSTLIKGFSQTVTGIGSAWARLRTVTAAPVRYVINPVVNRGLRGVWNTVASRVPGLGTMPTVPGFQKGGTVDLTRGGKLPGYSARDNRLAMVRDGEGVLTPETTDALGGAAFVNRANSLGRNAGKLLAGFASGGIVGLVNSYKRKADAYFPKPGAVAATRSALTPMANMVGNRYGRGRTFPGTGYKTLTAMNARILDQVHRFRHELEAGDGMAVVREARKHVGLSGRPNMFTREYMPGSWPWCGAFVGGTFRRAGAYKALNAVDWKPLVRSYRALPRVSSPKPGDLALYRGDDGHINIVTDPKRGETIGGNESDRVRRQYGYMRSASSYRRPAYAEGGVVDMRRGFWNQDSRETNSVLTPEQDSMMREIFAEAKSYDDGGMLPPGFTLAYNGTGKPEPVGHDLTGPTKVIVELKESPGGLLRAIRHSVRTEGGGDVQVAFGDKKRRR